jgi:hypothetical protein
MSVLIPELVEAVGGGSTSKAAAGAAANRYGAHARNVSQQQITPGGRNYQGVILAEFLVAVIVVAFLPLAAGAPNDGKAGPSPYRVNDMIQLVAIGAVYFILALFSSGARSGRVVAWFGGLLTIGILIAKVGSGQLSAAVSGVSGVDKATLDNN